MLGLVKQGPFGNDSRKGNDKAGKRAYGALGAGIVGGVCVGVGCVAGAAAVSAACAYRALCRGTRIFDLTDDSRDETGPGSAPFAAAGRRAFVMQIWYPAAASGNPIAPYQRLHESGLTGVYKRFIGTNSRLDAPVLPQDESFPVLIYGHHWNGVRTENTALFEELASRGYVVASVDHPYNSSRVLLGNGRVIAGTEDMNGPKGEAATAAERVAFWNRRLEVWVADDRFALDRLAALNADAASPLHGSLDTEHVGAFGHSFGGSVALALCGQDPRVKAAVNLDGWTFGALATRTTQPILLMYERVSLDRRKELLTAPIPGTLEDQLDRADDAGIEPSLERFGGLRLFVAGTQHLDFTDQPLLPPLHRGHFTGPIASARVNAITRATVAGFFDRELRGKDAAVPGFAEVTVESFAAPAQSARGIP